jgi:predicted nucleic-acid-binding protein
MRAVDTNVLVRLIRRDDEAQVVAAERYIEGGVWVSTLALAEAIWVLGSVYEADGRELARIVEMLLENGRLVIQDVAAVELALASFKTNSSLSFSDCLMVALAKKSGHLPLGTFDRKLSKLPGAERI